MVVAGKLVESAALAQSGHRLAFVHHLRHGAERCDVVVVLPLLVLLEEQQRLVFLLAQLLMLAAQRHLYHPVVDGVASGIGVGGCCHGG